jgi:hypothetical protein
MAAGIPCTPIVIPGETAKAKEAFHNVKGSIKIQKIQHCEEKQSASLTVTGVKNYQKFYTEIH